jgi:hypothetical protein
LHSSQARSNDYSIEEVAMARSAFRLAPTRKHRPGVGRTIQPGIELLEDRSLLSLFGAPLLFPAGLPPGAPVVADFNVDGKPDLAVVNSGAYPNGTVSVLLNNGFGGFAPAVSYVVGGTTVAQTGSLVAGDFNGDGRPDLAVSVGTALAVLLNHGDGTFAPALTLPTITLAPTAPSYLAVADFFGNGQQDLAVLNSSTVRVLRNDGHANFTLGGSVTVRPSNLLVVGDFNGDGRPDLVTTSSNGLTVLLNQGGGTFTPALSPQPVPYGAQSLAVGDLNGDGRADVVVANQPNLTVSLLPGKGDGTFNAPVFVSGPGFAAIDGKASVVVGDLNGDGKLDIAEGVNAFVGFGYPYSNVLTVFLGNGDGTFQNSISLNLGNGSSSAHLALGDFNGDGQPDFAVCAGGPTYPSNAQSHYSNDAVSLVLNTGKGPISGSFLGAFDPATATWHLNSSPGSLVTVVPVFQYGGANWTPVVGDWDGNGTVTIGVVDPATMTWYLRNENNPGGPDVFVPFSYGLPGWVPVVGDWTGSGHTGIGAFDPNTGTWYLRNEDSPGAPDAGVFQYGGVGWLPVVGDWDGNGTTTDGVVDPRTMTWYLRNSNSAGAADVTPFPYGGIGWRPVVGDWTSRGPTTVGAVDPATMTWYLRNSNSAGAPDVTAPFTYGQPGSTPLVGHFGATAHTGIGMFDPATATWYLRNETGAGAPDAGVFQYGAPGWIPVVGDWNDSGHTGIGVVDPATMTWYLRYEDSPGPPDAGVFQYGAPGWVPVAGYWGRQAFFEFSHVPLAHNTGIGVFDPATATWYLRNEVSAGGPDAWVVQFGAPGWTPVQDGWIGINPSIPVVVDPGTMTWYWYPYWGVPAQAQYGGVGWRPVLGDWNGDGAATYGAVDPNGVWYLSNHGLVPDLVPFAYGLGCWIPLVGNWRVGTWTSSPGVTSGRVAPQPLNEALTSLSEALATPVLGTKTTTFPANSAPPSATGSAVSVGEQAVRPWSSAQSAGSPAVRHAYLAERARTAALDELFAMGLA